MSVDWLYRRNNCKTCERADHFLAKNKIKAKTTVDARKTRFGPAEAIKIAHKADAIYATKGSKVVHIDMLNNTPDNDLLVSLMIGPSGNLRAPTLQAGTTLLVGFDEESYSKVLK